MMLFSTPFALLAVLLSGGIAYASHHAISDPPLGEEFTSRSLIDNSGGTQAVLLPVGPAVTEDQAREFAEAVDKFYHSVSRPSGASFQKTITVDVNFVIVNNTLNQGITQGQMQAQIDLLNNAFQPDFEFNLKTVQFVQNDRFFSGVTVGDPNQVVRTEVATAHKRGGKETLSVYVVDVQNNVAMFSYPFANVGVLDGIFLDYKTVPGGGRSLL
jgi:hypothetical protein